MGFQVDFRDDGYIKSCLSGMHFMVWAYEDAKQICVTRKVPTFHFERKNIWKHFLRRVKFLYRVLKCKGQKGCVGSRQDSSMKIRLETEAELSQIDEVREGPSMLPLAFFIFSARYHQLVSLLYTSEIRMNVILHFNCTGHRCVKRKGVFLLLHYAYLICLVKMYPFNLLTDALLLFLKLYTLYYTLLWCISVTGVCIYFDAEKFAVQCWDSKIYNNFTHAYYLSMWLWEVFY